MRPKASETQSSRAAIASAQDHDDPLDPPSYVASSLNYTEGWLAKLRVFGTGPEFCKIGRRIRYRRSAWRAWATENRHRSTSEYQNASARAGEA
jgi:hypothetical protein